MAAYQKTFRTPRKWAKLTKRDDIWTLSTGYRYEVAMQVVRIGKCRTLAVISANTWLLT